MRVGVKVGIAQVREFGGPPVNLDDVSPFHLAEVGAAAALVDAQDRLQRVEGAAVDVQVIGQQLANARAPAGLVDRRRVPRLKQQGVSFGARPGVGAEERLEVALQSDRGYAGIGPRVC